MNVNISLSFELICFLDWLMKHHKPLVQSMIQEAVDAGFMHELEDAATKAYNPDHFYESVVTFLAMLDKNLIQYIEDSELEQDETFLPATKDFDDTTLDARTIWFSFQQARKSEKTNRGKKSQKNGQNALLENLLKNWTPGNGEPLN